jgi:hypothetical protein
MWHWKKKGAKLCGTGRKKGDGVCGTGGKKGDVRGTGIKKVMGYVALE